MGGSQSYSLSAVTQWYIEGSRLYGRAGFLRAQQSFGTSDLSDMSGKVVAITGANKGIGFATAKQLVELNAEVHLLCRSLEKAEETKKNHFSNNKNVFCHELDVSNFSKVKTFAETFKQKHTKLDVLINNAGCMPLVRTLTDEGNEMIMSTALGGTMLLTHSLLPVLKNSKSPRVINVSSGGAYTVRAPCYEDLNTLTLKKYDGTLVYAFAKRIQIELTEMWSVRSDTGSVFFASMHPGWADTEGLQEAMADFHEKNKASLRTATQGADTVVFLASHDSSDMTTYLADNPQKYTSSRHRFPSGKFWFDRNIVRTHMPLGFTDISDKDRQILWTKCESFVGGLN